jgi:hypothetical protein
MHRSFFQRVFGYLFVFFSLLYVFWCPSIDLTEDLKGFSANPQLPKNFVKGGTTGTPTFLLGKKQRDILLYSTSAAS